MNSLPTKLFCLGSGDRKLIEKYGVSGPRYTSYPAALQFDSQFTKDCSPKESEQYFRDNIAPLSIYVHIPFCQKICYFCACNKIVTSDYTVSRQYLDYLAKEMKMQSARVGKHRNVIQLNLGGGTPTFLDGAELTELMHMLAKNFSLSDSNLREYSIEIDPRTVTRDSLALLKGLGFNRLSLGVQDFDERVQEAINRKQRFGLVQKLTETARLHGFKSVSYDFIYGLPFQTPKTLEITLRKIVELSPDRIAFYNYAHFPMRFKSQRAIARHDLPSLGDKVDMLGLITGKLVDAGYQHIGMDHFAKSDDDLAVAQRHGKLQRNFQGYSTSMAPDLIGIGVSAISSSQQSYVQNSVLLEDYYRKLDENSLPIAKGVQLSFDDRIRWAVISNIICNLALNVGEIENRFAIVFPEYFAQELSGLKSMENDGLVIWDSDILYVSELGRIMLVSICRVFDRYLQDSTVIKFSEL
ncbi:MAG: oxygen-independent coproporphyrinogen-3 oxidase [Gammaproteobacteria bacterium]|jgi:oxygen-independent coproporphyrinogen-3 oxidase